LEALNLSLTPIAHESLDERNYGIFTGRNKWEIKKELGDEEFQKLRRGWNVSIPDGETLLDVYERVVPYFLERILPELQSERTVLIVAHGNSLRALVKYLQNLNSEELAALEIGVGEAYIYAFDEAGKAVLEEVRAEYPDKMNV
jgi:2,3-bisphosphoglycerate-dependent phosphoglycerate mutase